MIAEARGRLLASLAGLAVVASIAGPARAGDLLAAPAPSPAIAPSPAPATSLALVVDADSIDAGPLKQLLADDLSIQITLETAAPPPALRVHSLGPARVAVVFMRPDGSEIRRSLDLPHKRPLATETVAYAAANLLRNEAADLLAALQKAAPPPAVAASPPTPAAAAPAPAAQPLAPSPPPADTAPPSPCERTADLPFGADFAPFVGTSTVQPDRVRILSLNFAGGLAGGLHGFELGAGINVERRFACGLQMAGLANVVKGPVEGVQFAAFNFAAEAVQGTQIGGIAIGQGAVYGVQAAAFSVGSDAVHGAQIGIGALAAGPLRGAQLTTVNLALDDVQGLQAGLVQIARTSMQGMQIGTFNLVGGPLTGGQLGAANIAGDQVTGMQLGAVNFAAGRVSGTQIGIANYADDSDASIGLVSIVRHGRTDIEAWGTESGLVVAGVRHGTARLHNVYGAGVGLGGEHEWALVFGLGVHAPLGPWLGLDVDLLQTWLQKGVPFTGDDELSTLQATFAVPLGSVAEVLVAPTFNVLYGDDPGTGVAPPWPTFDFFDGQKSFVRGWFGISGGLRVRL